MPCEDFLVGSRQPDLADGGGGLGLFQRQDAVGQAQDLAAKGDGAGGDEDHVGAACLRLGHVEGEGGEPVLFQPRAAVDEERGADLHDQPLGDADVRRVKRQGCHGVDSSAGASAVMVA
jgi:hypothetical protein